MPELSFVSVPLETRFRCAHCGTYRRALVQALGQGGRNVWESSEAGDERALADAKKHAERTLLFVPCPACGKLSNLGPGVRLRIQLLCFVAMPLLVLAICAGSAAWVGIDGAAARIVFGVSFGISILSGVFAYAFHAKPWTKAESRTQFLSAKER
ncbi:MAG: hypothetical protein IPI67_15715 [Myxococcales bacterium]|nr:hypothetical protein [Myxococcales bacterium]